MPRRHQPPPGEDHLRAPGADQARCLARRRSASSLRAQGAEPHGGLQRQRGDACALASGAVRAMDFRPKIFTKSTTEAGAAFCATKT